MLVADIIKKQQPEIYKKLIELIGPQGTVMVDGKVLGTAKDIDINFPEDDPYFRKYRDIMTEKKGVHL